MSNTPLFLSYDQGLDWLDLIPYGTVADRLGEDRWHGVDERFGFLLDRPGGEIVGFKVMAFTEFDAEAEAVAEIFEGPRFQVPALGLSEATPGEILLAARPFLGGASTLDRVYFNAAMDESGEVALRLWIAALQAGNSMAHYGAGYTLLELDRNHEAYRHLRRYTELVPRDAWAWDYRARAAAALGDTFEALTCCRRALILERETDEETEARELLVRLVPPDSAGMPPSDGVEHHGAGYGWPDRLTVLERISAGEGEADYAAEGEGAWWIVHDSGTLADFLDDDNDATMISSLIQLVRYDDRERFERAVATLRAMRQNDR